MIATTAAAAAKRNDMTYPPWVAILEFGSPAEAGIGASGWCDHVISRRFDKHLARGPAEPESQGVHYWRQAETWKEALGEEASFMVLAVGALAVGAWIDERLWLRARPGPSKPAATAV
jgi:hypothetical protein